ncbi:MAG: UDP-N-acetylmuramoyl-L-alanine--D-glutamate ligase, partial [Peptostreptococcaceae bacterium]|nr:UDP-N-acetylmuramoyl-L-alanine--D-glutamate ligase [Peptostreptococcaceae bacterium]
RLQLVKVVDGVSYVNDSKGTNVDSTIRAIQAIENPIILIAGGYDKHVDFDEMIKTFDKRVKKLVLFGQTKEKIKNTALKYGFDEIEILDNLKQCVDYCKAIAKKGDTVLLSPACASWDMYSSYEVRGDEFIEIVNSL